MWQLIEILISSEVAQDSDQVVSKWIEVIGSNTVLYLHLQDHHGMLFL